jgi:hypothetical protein
MRIHSLSWRLDSRALALALIGTLAGCASSNAHTCPCKEAVVEKRPVACVIEPAEPGALATAPPAVDETTPPPAPSPQSTPQAIELIREALAADQAGDLDTCISKDREVLKLEDSARSRLHLASCENRKGKLVDALKDSEKALESGIANRDPSVMKIARARVIETLQRIPHVTFRRSTSVNVTHVRFDNREVPLETLEKKFSVDPGAHVVEVVTEKDGRSQTDTCNMHIAERTFNPVRLR